MKEKLYPWHGDMISISDASRICGIEKSTINWRMLQKGMTLEQATDTPVRYQKPRSRLQRFQYHGEMRTRNEIANMTGLSWECICKRSIKYDVSIEEAADMVVYRTKPYPWYGEMITICEAARRIGISEKSLRTRMKKYGMSLEQAAEYLIAQKKCSSEAKRLRMVVQDIDPYKVNPAEFAQRICSDIYSSTPEESEFSEVEPSSVYTFGSRHWRCRVEVDGNLAELQVFWAKSGKLSLVRKYRQIKYGTIKMIVEDNHAGHIHRR